MKYRFNFVIIIMSFLLISCGTGLKTPREELSGINSNFKGTFPNIAYKKTCKKNMPMLDSDILTLLNLSNKKSDSVSISFTSSNEIAVTYNNEIGKSTEYFQGEFSKGYFEIFLRKKNIKIPPFFPILYSNTDIYRIRISQTKENDLIIDKYYERGGNVFFFGGGGYGRAQYYFKRTQ